MVTVGATAPTVDWKKVFTCDVSGCGRGFNRAAGLGRHQQAIHGIPGKSKKAKSYGKSKAGIKKERGRGRVRPGWADPMSDPVADIKAYRGYKAKARRDARVAANAPSPSLDEAIAALELKIQAMREVIDLLKEMAK